MMIGFGSMLKDYLDYYKISQSDFAMRLGISTKHMNEILNGNTNLSEELILAISQLTNIDINLIFLAESRKKMYQYLHTHFKNDQEIKAFLKSFYLKDLVKKNWIVLKDESSDVQNSLDLLNFLQLKNFDLFDDYLENRALFKKKEDANQRKIYLWIKHCDNLVKDMDVEEYDSSKLPLLLEELRKVRNTPFNKERLIALFAKYGIYLVIEDAIQGTKARGCMMVKKNNPAIYLTKYYKEKSSFYYALYHELKHVKTDYNKGKAKILVDDEVETEADLFALNEMIPEKTWKEILNNYDQREAICQRDDIPLCFLYGRLAYNGLIKYSSKEYNAHKEMI